MNWMLISALAFALTLIPLGDSVSAQKEPQYEREESEEISGGAASPIGPLNSPPDDGNMASQRALLLPSPQITIEGINFIEDLILNHMIAHIPPDPFAVAGSDNLVSVVNTSIEWFAKDGTAQNSQSLSSFFGPLSPMTNTFDPKVIYDQYAGRFVVVTLERTGSDSAGTSRILIAVSDDSNSNGTWHFQSINAATIMAGVDNVEEVHWADYPGLAVNDDAVYITSNMYSFDTQGFGGVRLWIVPKGLDNGGLYDGGTSATTVHSPCDSVGQGEKFCFTLQPAHMFGSTPTGVGTYLTMLSGLQSLEMGNEVALIIRVDDPLGTPTFAPQFVDVGNIDDGDPPLPDALQSGASVLVEVNDRRALHSVWRGNSLFVTNTIVPRSGPDSGQTTAHWLEFDTSALASLSLADQGDIGGEEIAAGTFTFVPSIAVNGLGEVGIGFAASAPSIFPGAYYTGRQPSDPAGTMQPIQVLREGLDIYVRTFSGSRNRWGDYSSVSVDPADDRTFWVYNQYAINRGNASGGDGQWGTALGSFNFDTNVNVSGVTSLQVRADTGGRALVEISCPISGFTADAVPADDGTWQIAGVPADTCELTATAPGYLSAEGSIAVRSASMYLPANELVAGDTDRNDFINIIDISEIIAQFGQPAVDCEIGGRVVDLDCNGILNINDITLAISNFGKGVQPFPS